MLLKFLLSYTETRHPCVILMVFSLHLTFKILLYFNFEMSPYALKKFD